ncbi:MAG TPA: DUF4234 domain-containing protein [Sandaracinaceae bacterium LLY-WYZ-13_1]|nr:DUF4234 domain-containing protein [Sandaracinaceae bacterium LLY-WYZ-13_1]
MTRREAWIPPVLSFVTCGIYYIYWQYVTTEELKQATGRDDLNPMMDLIITFLCCGVWAVYVQYRNAQVVHEAFQSAGQRHEDKSTMVLIMWALSFLNGITSFVGMMILQDELNKLADFQSGGGGGFGGGQPMTF